MRSVVYHEALPSARRAAHRALADSLADASPVRAWHDALAATGPDEAVAGALDDAAAVTGRRGAPAIAGRSWELASRLSPAVEDRVRRLRLAADALLDAGMAPAAGGLLARAEQAINECPHADDVVERVRRQQLRCRLPPSNGGEANPVAALRAAAHEVARVSPAVAVDVLLDALAAYLRAGALGDIADTIDEAVRSARCRRRRSSPAHRRDPRRAARFAGRAGWCAAPRPLPRDDQRPIARPPMPSFSPRCWHHRWPSFGAPRRPMPFSPSSTLTYGRAARYDR